MFKNNLAKYNDFKAGFGSEEMIKNEITGYFPKANKNCNIQLIIELGYKRTTKLHWVRIFFATPTFDRITKDEKANFETKLSTIGGTMGLLTGFSIISGVEVIYFAVKMVLGIIKRNVKPKIHT